jgi:hypothetical protein
MVCPELFDSSDVVEDMYRFHEQFGRWPHNLEEIKLKLPDHEFDWSYEYYHNEDIFVVIYNCECDYAYFYRSDTKTWKEFCLNKENHQEFEGLKASMTGRE